LIEKNETVGETWHENRYLGCGVDTPNHFYSYSFEPSHEWTEFYSKRDEQHRYFEISADKYDLRRDICFEMEVNLLIYDEASASCGVSTGGKDGAEKTLKANAVITAVGQLNRRKLPDIPGLHTFEGPAFHIVGWADDPKAYLGISVPKFPNLFVLYGPNTDLGHGLSAIFHGECQMRYTMKCLNGLIEGDQRTMEVRKDVNDIFIERCEAAYVGACGPK